MVRKNSIQPDSGGICGLIAPGFRMNVLLLLLLAQAINLVVFVWFNRATALRLAVYRQQLGVYQRSAKRPILKNGDRLFWVVISRLWKDWRSELFVVRPETLIRWRKRKFREFWRRKSHGKVGRPPIPKKHIQFIRRSSSDHPEYGEDRIALELELKFGIEHSSATIRKYRAKGGGSRDSQAWQTFLRN